ncbi:response regulator [Dyadobacter sandarakinus]|uniref:histidine kinase n=1 Tax=Dyadobacter sandarakinus TaxID=2747268 RepID=A0ABX7I2T3_9BACT|nr:response regulator [Dyadobacter sandarakinus]QRR00028.1 response regulator [Dyadobacter sandarakinus]
MNIHVASQITPVEDFRTGVKERSDSIINYILSGYFLLGLFLASFYETWFIAVGVGGILLVAYYSTKLALPESDLYQYVLSTVLGIFMAQFIYQMHGLFEMHFFAFIGSAVLITYQNWKLQIPMMLVVLVHHSVFGYLQNSGLEEIYFTKLDYFDIMTFAMHMLLAAGIFGICGLWSYRFEKYYQKQISQTRRVGELEKEVQLSLERKNNEEIQRRINAELRASNAELDLARQQAEEGNKAKSAFLATMSHEIRTPINGMVGMAALLKQSPLSDEQHMFAETILNCGDTLTSIINDILDFSKIETGKLELENDDLNLRQTLEDVFDVFGVKAAGIGLDLIYEIDERVPLQIVGDDSRLKQVLVNLIGNAVKFTERGEVCVYVYPEKELHDGQLQLRFDVRDTGIGIQEEKLGGLFDAFTQIDSSTTRKYGGSGLGLAISKNLVTLMGGEMSVHSTLMEGSTFSFSIKTVVGTKTLSPYQDYNMGEHWGKKILIVDDNFTNLTILRRQMENWQLVPVLASSGEEALGILADNQGIDLVVTDMQMPLMDGITLARNLRSSGRQIPLILLSSVGEPLKEQERQLFTSVLTKPIRQHILSKHIINALQQHTKIGMEAAQVSRFQTNLAKDFPYEVLVVDDNAINQHVIVRVLQKLGYQPDIANNGREAVEAANSKNYGLVLMDMQMPVMDGVEATRLIRKTVVQQPIIIALTANTLEEDRQQCLNAGMNDYMSKPININEVTSKIKLWYK